MAKEHLPIYGVGPFYTIGIISCTVLGIIFSSIGFLESGKIENTVIIIGFVMMGIFLMVSGFCVWKMAVLGNKSIGKYIESNRLCTTGVYSIVRNPIYSGIMFMCTGALMIAHNLWLLFLPFLYWIAMTIMLKCSEEKWLRKLYGQEYAEYCRRVNRCIPWRTRKC